jgi:hypothetical protein
MRSLFSFSDVSRRVHAQVHLQLGDVRRWEVSRAGTHDDSAAYSCGVSLNSVFLASSSSLRTIMEQRALYLAEISYKRAQDSAKAAQAMADALEEEANPALKGRKALEQPETEDEALERKKAMRQMISKAMDEDAEGAVLFDEGAAEWAANSSSWMTKNRAYEYVYAYELENQKAEGMDDAQVKRAGRRKESQPMHVPLTDVDFGFEESYPQQAVTVAQDDEPQQEDQQEYDENGAAEYTVSVAAESEEYDRPPSPSRIDVQEEAEEGEYVQQQPPQRQQPRAPISSKKPAAGNGARPTPKQAVLAQQAKSQMMSSMQPQQQQQQQVKPTPRQAPPQRQQQQQRSTPGGPPQSRPQSTRKPGVTPGRSAVPAPAVEQESNPFEDPFA